MSETKTTDERLLELGFPQDAIDRLLPEINGPVEWDDALLRFVSKVIHPPAPNKSAPAAVSPDSARPLEPSDKSGKE